MFYDLLIEHGRDAIQIIIEKVCLHVQGHRSRGVPEHALRGLIVRAGRDGKAYPTIATDYIPAIFDDDMAEYLEYFLGSMPAFAQPAYVAGSFTSDRISDYYRSPVELGWSRTVNTNHEFLGKDALELERASPKRVLRTLEWDADDVVDVFASLYRPGQNNTFMDMPRDQKGFMWTDRVEANGKVVGVATSRAYSYFFRKMPSLATIDVEHAGFGSELSVIWGNPGDSEKVVRATVAPALQS